MSGARTGLGLTAILLLAGGIVMDFFIILSGTNHNPVNLVYFLQASTGGVTGGNSVLKNPARWTSLAICGVAGSRNSDCSNTKADQSFDPYRNFGTTTGLPGSFGGSYYYYMSRFAWAMFLIALAFACFAFLISLAALLGRLGAYMTGLLAALALFFQSIAAALMTAWTVQARNAFRSNGQTANLGKYAYGFAWGTWAAFFLATLFFCIGGGVSKKDNYGSKKNKGYFGRKRSTRSRGSFIDHESEREGRGVKDEYE